MNLVQTITHGSKTYTIRLDDNMRDSFSFTLGTGEHKRLFTVSTGGSDVSMSLFELVPSSKGYSDVKIGQIKPYDATDEDCATYDAFDVKYDDVVVSRVDMLTACHELIENHDTLRDDDTPQEVGTTVQVVSGSYACCGWFVEIVNVIPQGDYSALYVVRDSKGHDYYMNFSCFVAL